MVIRFEELPSTNTYIKEHAGELEPYTAVTASFQSAGRGQRGNSWESEPGKNLLLSMLFVPPEHIVPARQFLISQAVSTGMLYSLAKLLVKYETPPVTVKWPNDIYIGDRKVAGILIENTISAEGGIARSIVGVGLNVNQRVFRSDAPNPVSLIEFTGMELDLREVAETVADDMAMFLGGLKYCHEGSEALGLLRSRYLAALWRSGGFYPYVALKASAAPAPTAVWEGMPPKGDTFEAEIVEVASDGPVTMRLRDGSLRTFAFKEIAPVLS